LYTTGENGLRGGVYGEQEDEDVVFMGPGNLTRRRSFFRLHCIAGPAILIVFRIGGELLIKNWRYPRCKVNALTKSTGL